MSEVASRFGFADRVWGLSPSAIRELLKLSQKPGIISFAGGYPDSELFAREEIGQIALEEITKNYGQALAYCTTDGNHSLRATLIDWLLEDDICFFQEQAIITTGSQQGLDLLAKIFINPGDVVICGLPTYLGAIQAFRSMQASLRGVPLQEGGMDIDALEVTIKQARSEGRQVRFIYTVPDFQNPSSITWSEEKRDDLLCLASACDLLIIEDMPYRQLRFEGATIPSIASLDAEGRVIILFTLSKLLSPGLRLGLLAGPQEVVEKATILKQSADLCTSSLSQCIAEGFFRLLQEKGIRAYIQTLRNHYRRKCGAMLEALEKSMPNYMGIKWSKPEGGLFVWLTLPRGLSAERMLPKALEQNVAYVPGAPFFVDGRGHNTLRLCFSQPSIEEIQEGIARLAKVINKEADAQALWA